MSQSLSPPTFGMRDDGKPRRTKIVATIGARQSYDKGVVLLDGRKVDTSELDLGDLVKWLSDGGADIIRINLSHAKNLEDVANTFAPIKEVILEREGNHPNPKRVAVLADLPGPKIRFDIKNEVKLTIGQDFTIALDREVSDENVQTVYIDDLPLKQALERVERTCKRIEQRQYMHLLQPRGEESRTREEARAAAWETVENLLGNSVAPAGRNHFQELVDRMTDRLHNNEQVLVFVGEADVVIRIKEVVLDPQAELHGEVLTVKSDSVQGKKGFTLKGLDFDIPAFTERDRDYLGELLRVDYAEGTKQVLTFVGLSFTQTADDVLRARYFMERELVEKYHLNPQQARLRSPAIIAKIETYRGWKSRHFILDVTDGVMVARGDLGLQVDIELLPDMQKRLILLSNKRGKPVITATQMLSSMTESIEPTRAEVSDVFNAIQDGTDAVMLSEETAKGRFPLNALEKVVAIAGKAEMYYELQGFKNPMLRDEQRRRRVADFMKDDYERIRMNERRIQESQDIIALRLGQLDDDSDDFKEYRWRNGLYKEKLGRARTQEITNRITESACFMAEAEVVNAIITGSTSGRTTRMISRIRARVIIVGAAHDDINTRKLAVSYGVVPICVGSVTGSLEDLFDRCQEKVLEHDFLGPLLRNQVVIFTGGFPLERPGTTNMLQFRTLKAVGG